MDKVFSMPVVVLRVSLSRQCFTQFWRLRSCSSSRSSISCGGTEAYSMQAIVFPAAPVHVFDVPCCAGCAVSQVVCSLGHTDDMPVVGNNRCLELDSVVLQIDVSVVADAGSYGPDCSVKQRGRRLGYAFCVGPTGLDCVCCVSPSSWCRPFLVLQYIIEHIIWFRGFFAQHKDSRRFGLMCRYCHMLMVCFRSSFLWSSIIASMIFAVVGFFSAKNSKVSAFMVSLVVSRLVSWSFLVCDGHVHALTQLTCQWTQLSCRWTHLSCRRTQL